jgi:uracil-DNA glycosylase family 4
MDITKLLHQHETDFCNGCGNEICKRAYKRAFFDSVPEDTIEVEILFVGEGPGEAEDMLGVPFIGPAGRLLREAITEVCIPGVSYGFTNLVACRPTEGEKSRNRPPTPKEINSCAGRFKQILHITCPKVTVAVGQVPREHLQGVRDKGYFRAIPHPSFILRKGGTKSHLYHGYLEQIKKIFECVKEKEGK